MGDLYVATALKQEHDRRENTYRGILQDTVEAMDILKGRAKHGTFFNSTEGFTLLARKDFDDFLIQIDEIKKLLGMPPANDP